MTPEQRAEYLRALAVLFILAPTESLRDLVRILARAFLRPVDLLPSDPEFGSAAIAADADLRARGLLGGDRG